MTHPSVDTSDDALHASMATLIRSDFGELIWRDRARLGPIAPVVSPHTGQTHLHDAVAKRKLSAVKWLVRLGGRVREPRGGPLSCPWVTALQSPEPLPILRLLLTSPTLTPDELAQCADDLVLVRDRARSRGDITTAYAIYAEVCQRVGRDPGPPPETGSYHARTPE